MNIFSKIVGSSTFWVSIVIPVAKLVLDLTGISVPWEVICTAIGGYAVKEAASKFK